MIYNTDTIDAIPNRDEHTLIYWVYVNNCPVYKTNSSTDAIKRYNREFNEQPHKKILLKKVEQTSSILSEHIPIGFEKSHALKY